MIDQVWLKILHSQFVNICEEMAVAMMRTAYSPIFSEGLDFTFLILDAEGDLIAMADMNPAMLGQALFSGRWVIEDLSDEELEPGDVVVHNDPYRGGSHMPEHLLVTPFFHRGKRRGFLGTIGHVAEIGGMAPGSFASNATEIYQEGLRLPPVKLMRRGEPARDVWRIMMANHRTPESTWGDFHAMVGALNVGLGRMDALYDEHGVERIEAAVPALYDYAEAWMRRDIAALPDGTFSAQDCQEDDGFERRPFFIRCDVTIDGDRIVVDYSRTDAQATGVINGPYVVTASATYNGIFQVIGSQAPINAGAFRPIDIVAPAGTVVNVRHPGACVGGQTELQPRLLDLIQGKILGQIVPERCAAACGGTSCNFLFGGVHPRTGEYYTHYNFEGIGWGGRRHQRREQRADSPARQLPEHPDGDLRVKVPVAAPRLPAQHRRRWPGTRPRRARSDPHDDRRGGRDHRERAVRPLAGLPVGTVRRRRRRAHRVSDPARRRSGVRRRSLRRSGPSATRSSQMCG